MILELDCPTYTVTIGILDTCNITVIREIEDICVTLMTHDLNSLFYPYPTLNVSICFDCKYSSK